MYLLLDKVIFPPVTLRYSEDDLVYELNNIPSRIPNTTKRSKVKFCTFNALMRVHHKTLHNIKTKMYKVFTQLILQAPKPLTTLSGTYTAVFIYYAPDRRRRDLSGMLSYIDKFLLDTLVTTNVLVDDNASVITETHYIYGGVINGGDPLTSFYLFKNTIN